MAIRLVAVDVDGTLVTADQRVLPRVQAAAQRALEHGIQLVLCTGRAPGECWYILDALPQIRYAVTQTGAIAQDLKTGETLYHCPLSPDDARLIYSHVRRYDGLVNFFSGGIVYNSAQQMAQFERYYPADFRWLFERSHEFVDDLDAMVAGWDKPVEKLYVPFSSREECEKAMADLTQLPYFVTGAGYVDLEAMNPHTSKGIALEALCRKLGIPREQVMAIGDSGNDAAMLDFAGVGVAMGNGEEALKQRADLIAPTNEEGGVADMLELAIKGEIKMGVQDLTVQMVVIVVIGVFFASFMDAIAGGGGIISVPTYLLAGLPMHFALGTNKFSSSIGTAFSTGRYIKNGYVDWKLGIPSIVLALIGSFFGTKLQLMLSEVYLQYLLLIVLPVVAFVVLRQRQLPEERGDIDPRKQMAIVYLAALVVGAYDGFYGPGTGTFLLLIFCNLGKLDVRTAGGNVKLVNLSSNIASLLTSLLSGKVFLVLGLIGTVSSILGHFIGAGLAIKNGSKIVKPAIIIVLLLLAAKVVQGLIAG